MDSDSYIYLLTLQSMNNRNFEKSVKHILNGGNFIPINDLENSHQKPTIYERNKIMRHEFNRLVEMKLTKEKAYIRLAKKYCLKRSTIKKIILKQGSYKTKVAKK